MLSIYDDGLAEALLYSKKDVAVLYGSPLSTYKCSSGTVGVENVSGIVSLIESFVKKEYPDLFDKYKETCLIEGFNDIEKYQSSFEFLHQYTDPVIPNEIIKQAVLNAYKGEVSDYKSKSILRECEKDFLNWEIPPAIESLASILKLNSKFSGPVITTNFDPLLRVALGRINEEPSLLVFHNDGSLEKQIDDRLKIVHIHGHWLESDTLHTYNQLNFKRVQLINSLKKILRNKTLFVIGYGGWEDVFINALKEVAEDDDVDLNIIWAFFENCQTTINSKYKKLIEIINPVITRGRFRAYSGIDGHTFLKKFNSKLNETLESKNGLEVDNEIENHEVEIIKDNINNGLSKWYVNVDPVNYVIRTTERELLKEYIDKNRIINLVSDWGVSKDEFIFSSFNKENEHDINFYKVDLSSVDSVDDFLDTFKDNFGVEVQQFITKLPKGKNVVVLDNFSSKNDYVIKKVIDITQAMMDYNPFTNIIVCSDVVIGENFIKFFKLGRLEEFDCIKYINFFLGDSISEDEQDSLVELSLGVPQYLKKLIEDLDYGNIEEVIRNNSKPAEIIECSEDNIPKEIIRRVEGLAALKDSHSQRAYTLLKNLCLLKYGDVYSNLKKMGQGYNFKISHLKELDKLGLIKKSAIGTSIEIKSKSASEDKIHEVKELVREYLFTKMTEREIEKFLKIIADSHFGSDWKFGSISLSPQNKKLLGLSSKFALSLKYVAVSLLRFLLILITQVY
ncbi:SIR2 family protein [Pseudoalteromonas sp. T1lg21]|uniref:SIR2 family protein n=1 Tax=Pseudoalteromonas sp. T1lg21 TaxID=2077095 RepID=UPI000CF70D4D|nr:SIR2 family protein [Pseudoalteromonas sp. T1lg21]